MSDQVARPEPAASERLLDDFTPPTYEEWKAVAVASLKGAPFEKKVFTHTYEGIELKPIYWREDIRELPLVDSFPGEAPYVRGSRVDGSVIHTWGICQALADSEPAAFNRNALDDLSRGQTELNIVLDRPSRRGVDPDEVGAKDIGFRGLSLGSLDDVGTALAGIEFSVAPIHMDCGTALLPLLALLSGVLKNRGISPAVLTGMVGMDPLGVLVREGSLPKSLDAIYDDLTAAARWAQKNAPRLRTILVSGIPYHDAGAGAVQELGYALSAGVEYIRALLDRGCDIDDIAPRFRYSFSLGANFFMEIAKLRAARALWSRVIDAFGGREESQAMNIFARTSAWTKTVYDPYVNMLRNTTEALSGVVGGADSLMVAPFDEPVRPADEFSRRVSRNLQLLLKHESHLTIPIDPGGGSWYIESLTDELARKAWELFQCVEGGGGLAKTLIEGTPQAAIEDTARKRAGNLATRKDIFVGTNMYPNLEEKSIEADTTDYAALAADRADTVRAWRAKAGNNDQSLSILSTISDKTASERVDKAIEAALAGATLGALTKALTPADSAPFEVKPLRIHRGAEPYEQLRRAADRLFKQTGQRIQVFLANIGPIPQHKPRADFTTGFFQVGGFEVLTNHGFDTPDEAAQAALDSAAPIVVICSTDKVYPEVVPPLVRRIKETKPSVKVILAGKPAPEFETVYREAGLDEAIHIRANCWQLLFNLQQEQGLNHE